jgi:CubicO group peptidase (beta-lactamase class C family)
MRLWRAHRAWLLVLAGLGTGCGASAPTAPTASSTTTLRERVDQEITPGIQSGRWSSVVVGVYDRGQRDVFAYGRARDNGLPDGRTLYEIGSVTKTFTAALLVGLDREGLLGLTDPVRRHLPKGVGVPTFQGQEITLQQLSTHVSGLPRLPNDLTTTPGFDETDPYAHYSPDLLYRFLGRYTLTRAPGASYEYSNLGVGLLGQSLAWQLGTSYEEAVLARVIAPLGLADTRITLSSEQQTRLATGHASNGSPVPYWTFDALAGAGALRSSAEDLLSYVATNLGRGPSPLTADLAACHVPRYTAPDGSFQVGLGWHMSALPAAGPMHVWHDGGTGGFTSYVGFVKGRDAGVVVLSGSANTVAEPARNILAFVASR